MSFEAVAEGSGLYRVYVDDVEVSQHTTERKAMQEAVSQAKANPDSAVHYDHDYRVNVQSGGIYLYIEEEEVA